MPSDALLDPVRKLDAWLERHDYKAYDPFDGLNARLLRPLAVGTFGKQLLQQGVRRFPVNLRPLLGIRPEHSSKGFGYLARGYLKLHRLTGDPRDLDKALHCLGWLREHAVREHGGMAWGNHFDYQSRVFFLPKGMPTIVWVSLIGQAFVDAWELTGDEQHLRVAREACTFLLQGVERRAEGHGLCISYIPGQYKAVHNANMLAAALLARVGRITLEPALMLVARTAVDYTAGAQRPDGSWWYGEAPDLRWVDNFHTGYVLDALWGYMEASSDRRHLSRFERGARHYLDHFFLPDGTPRYYAQRTYPIDIQCAAQSIETLSLLARVRQDPQAAEMARRVAAWTIRHMQDRSGYFYFRRLRFGVNRTPTLHWGQGTMLHALAVLMLQDASAPATAEDDQGGTRDA